MENNDTVLYSKLTEFSEPFNENFTDADTLNSLLLKKNYITYRDIHNLARNNLLPFYLFVILQSQTVNF